MSASHPLRVALPHLLFSGIALLSTTLGLRGFGREGVDFFTMKPFSDPLTRCRVAVFEEQRGRKVSLPFPAPTYRYIPGPSFTARLYLERLPLHAEGLKTLARRTHPEAEVSITCRELHGNQTFTSSTR